VRTLARAAMVIAVTSSACATDRPVTWEDLGFSRSEPARDPPKSEGAKAQAPDAIAPRAGADAAAEPEPLTEKLTGPPDTPLAVRKADVAVDLTPHGRVLLPGVQTDTVEDGALVRVDAMTLVCVADARALVDTALVFDRLDEEAQKLGATLGAVRMIWLARDPARSISDPPPRACRTLVKDAPLKAPLSRQHAPKSTWLVTAGSASVLEDSARAVARIHAGAHQVTAPPRAIVDESGTITALVIPVDPAPGGS
jgi:hypothetical protein